MQHGKRTHTKGARSFELAARHAHEAATHDFAFIARKTQCERQDAVEDALAQDRPHEALADPGDRWEERTKPVIEEPNLDKKWRSANDRAEALGEPCQRPRP